MSALRPAFFILYLESFISRLNVILCHDLTLSVSEPDNAAAQTGAGTSFGANGDPHTRAAELSTYFCILTIRKHLLKMRFERSGRGQEPSRGHKFSILENSCPFGTASCWGVPAPNPARNEYSKLEFYFISTFSTFTLNIIKCSIPTAPNLCCKIGHSSSILCFNA